VFKFKNLEYNSNNVLISNKDGIDPFLCVFPVAFITIKYIFE